jgi:PAS domain S-box-containing protein
VASTSLMRIARIKHQTRHAAMDRLLDLVALEHTGDTLFQTCFDISPDCMFHVRVEGDGRFVYDAANRTALSSLGLTLDQLLGQTPEDMLGPDKGRMVTQALRLVCATGRPYRYEPTWQQSPSGPVTYDAVYIPERNVAGDIVGILGIARNITRQRALEASLHQSRKMEAMGQLTSGVAHDFNNVLANIQACLQLMKREFPQDGAQQLIDEAARTIGRGKSLTDRMLDFARFQPVALQPVDLNALVERMIDLLTRTLGPNICIEKRSSGASWQTLADRNELEVAVLNIAINARDAMPNGGRLTIETGSAAVPAGAVEGLPASDYATMSFADTGEGMPEDVLAHVFEPFYTTKPLGKGTGLGLSMINSMIQKLGGAITIESKLCVGTRITLYFPRAVQSEDEDQPPTSRPQRGIPPEQMN